MPRLGVMVSRKWFSGTSTMSLMALKSRVNLALALRSTRGIQLSLISIGVTLSYLEGLLNENLAALF